MHIKYIHEMIEDLAEYGKCMIEAGTGNGNVNLCEAGQIVDMIKDLADAEYHSLISKEMKEYKEEEEAEEKYMMRMLKEDHKDEYKKMREEYGEEDGERRFYDNYRYANGRFAPKGRGSYEPRRSGRRGRRGYEEPLIPEYYIMDAKDYEMYPPEYWRDMDRASGRMYYTSPANSSTSMNDGRTSSGNPVAMNGNHTTMNRDGKEGRSGQSRRTYMETKEMNKGNTPEEKRRKMTDLEQYMTELGVDISDMISDASTEEKNLLKQKLQVLTQKIQ